MGELDAGGGGGGRWSETPKREEGPNTSYLCIHDLAHRNL